jgi:RNA polymerase sigma-70 factor, ECF subfamily
VSDEPQALPELGADVRASWQRFLDTFEPLRPELYRYCRHLTHDPWDAEDLAQDTLARRYRV